MLSDDIVENEIPCLQQIIEMYMQYKTTMIGVQEIPLRMLVSMESLRKAKRRQNIQS